MDYGALDRVISERLRDQIKQDEGWSAHPYYDHLGYLTIGYGFLIDDRRRGNGMPREAGDLWLERELMLLHQRLTHALPWFDSAPDAVQEALINMAYQMGVGGLLGFRKTLARGEQGEWSAMADEALRSRWATQTPKRARRVTDLIRSAG